MSPLKFKDLRAGQKFVLQPPEGNPPEMQYIFLKKRAQEAGRENSIKISDKTEKHITPDTLVKVV